MGEDDEEKGDKPAWEAPDLQAFAPEEPVPDESDPEERLVLERVDDKFWRAEARRGFMERPDIQEILGECKAKGAEVNLDDVTYYVGHETVIPRENRRGMAHWQELLFAAMGRNAERISDYLDLPSDQVVEIGREIEI